MFCTYQYDFRGKSVKGRLPVSKTVFLFVTTIHEEKDNIFLNQHKILIVLQLKSHFFISLTDLREIEQGNKEKQFSRETSYV